MRAPRMSDGRLGWEMTRNGRAKQRVHAIKRRAPVKNPSRSISELNLQEPGEFIRNICLGFAALLTPFGALAAYLMDGFEKRYTGGGLDWLYLTVAGSTASLGMFLFCLAFFGFVMSAMGIWVRGVSRVWPQRFAAMLSGGVFVILVAFVGFYAWIFESAVTSFSQALVEVVRQVR